MKMKLSAKTSLLQLASALAALALFAPSATADGIHSFLYRLNGGDTPSGSFANVTDVAVDNSNDSSAGDLYVGEAGHHVVDKFAPGATSASFLCQITGLGELSTSPAECDRSAPGPGSFSGRGAVATDTATGDVFVLEPGKDEVQTYESPTSGEYTLTFEGQTTAPLPANAGETQAGREQIAQALESLPSVGAGNVAVPRLNSPDPREVRVSFVGALAGTDVPQMTAAGGSPVPAVTTAPQGAPSHLDRFSSGGAFEKRFALPVGELGAGIPFIPLRLAFSSSNGDLFLNEPTRVVEVNPATEAVTTFTTGADTPAGTFRLTGSETGAGAVAVDDDPSSANFGDVYAIDVAHKLVDRFNEKGEYECQITGAGSDSTSATECSAAEAGMPGGGFGGSLNMGLTVDPGNGNLYVGENGGGSGTANGVSEFTAAGDFAARLSNSDPEQEGIWSPFNLAVSASTGDLFIANLLNSSVEAFGPDQPVAKTTQASSVSPTSATLNGSVNPLGKAVTACRFEYVEVPQWEPFGTEPYAHGQTAPCEQPVGSGTSPVALSAHVSGLQAGRNYVFRLVAANAAGASDGEDHSFGPPLVKPEASTAITRNSATLNGAVDSQSEITTYLFEYGDANGEAGSYGHSQPPAPAEVGAGGSETALSQNLSGLQPGATYHYRLTATNASGTTHGPDRTLTTLAPALVDAQAASSIGRGEATLNAYVDPLGSATSYHFEWGTGTSYGNTTPTESAGAGSAPTLASAPLAGLQAGTEYHYRLVAENAEGRVDGPDEVFTTEAASCQNEKLREENDSTALPDCRAYEQVSPTDKHGSPVFGNYVNRISPDGERVVYFSPGAFAGQPIGGFPNEYLARRGAGGWATAATKPPFATVGGTVSLNVGYSADLSESLWRVLPGEPEIEVPTSASFFRRRADGSFVAVSPPIERVDGGGMENIDPVANSADGSTEILKSQSYPLLPDPLPTKGVRTERLYELAGLGTPSPALRLLQIDEAGNPITPCGNGSLALGFGGTALVTASFNEISSDGTHVFFSVESPQTGCAVLLRNGQIYARIDGTSTTAISNPPRKADCLTLSCATAPISGGLFAGASADGSRAFFLSTRQLTDDGSEDPLSTDSAPGGAGEQCFSRGEGAFGIHGPNGCNLYLYDFNRPAGHSLAAVSAGDPSGEGPKVQGVVRVAADGSQIYFVARGLLSGEPNALGQTAVSGADNLYVYNAETESVRFIAELCSGEAESGARTGVAQCGGDDAFGMWVQNSQNGLTPDGRYFVFVTHAQLTPDDENEAADIYRYDTQTGSLERISVGHRGEDGDGNGGGQAAVLNGLTSTTWSLPAADKLAEDSSRSISDDGQTILVATARPLQAGDENGKADLYEWHQGEVTMVSGGRAANDIQDPILSSSGRDIVFVTEQELVPEDRDGLADVYDARIGGGLPLPPPPPPACEGGESCRGAPGPEPQPPALGSNSLIGPPNALHCHRGLVKRHGHCVKRRRPHHRRGHSRHRSATQAHGGAK